MLTTALASSSCTCSNANDGMETSPLASGSSSPSPTSRSCRDNEPPSSGCSRRQSHHHQKSAQMPNGGGGGGTYVYPKLQLVQIDDAWYALNQTCLQIYQQLQMCGTAQLMPVDVVPLNKLPDCVRKSLSSCSSLDGDGKCATGNRRHKRDPAALDDRIGERRKSDESGAERHAFRVYDVMSDSVNGSGKPQPANQRQQEQPNNANHHNVANSDHEKSWWSRLFPYCSSSSGMSPQQHPESIRPDNSRRYAARQVHRRQHQIVEKLMEETSLIGGTGDIHHGNREASQQPVDPSSDGSSLCVICQSTFANHRLLQRHRERVNHYGCSVCFKSFKSSSLLQDHCDLLSHWSEGDSDNDSVDLDSDDEYFFSSETSDDD